MCEFIIYIINFLIGTNLCSLFYLVSLFIHIYLYKKSIQHTEQLSYPSNNPVYHCATKTMRRSKEKIALSSNNNNKNDLGARLASRRIRRQETGRKVERGTRKKCMTELDRHNVDGDVQAGAVVRGEATWTRARD